MKFTGLKIAAFVIATNLVVFATDSVVYSQGDGWHLEEIPLSQRPLQKFDFTDAPLVNVATLEELYTAVNNPANAGNQVVIAPGTYLLSVMAPGGAARPNGGRLELQANMSLRGVSGDRSAVVIDAANLPANSYTAPLPNTGAIRTGKGTNAVEWLTIKNATGGGAGIIVHLDAPGMTFVRIAHCVSTVSQRGIDIRNVASGATGYVIQAEIVDNDLFLHRGATAQGIRIVNSGGVSGNSITVNLNGNRIFDSQVGLLAQSIGNTNGSSVSVFSTGDRFYDNGGGVVIGGGFTASSNNTTNFTAVGSIFENNNAPFTEFYPGGLSVVGNINFQVPTGGSNNTANVFLRNCRFANNQVADLNVFGASSTPVSIGPAGTNNRANVKLYGTITQGLRTADSDPVNPVGMNTVNVTRPMPFDFDGDSIADLSVFRPSNQTWYLNRSQAGFAATQFGLASDKPAAGDFDGDGKADIAVARDNQWYWLASSNNQINVDPFGLAGDIPVLSDFDGDGRTEPAIYRNGVWWWLNRYTSQFHASQFGLATDKPIPADYDGDGRTDQAVFRNGEWHINRSGHGYTVLQFGLATDRPVPMDYDGDGIADLAVFRPAEGNWYIRNSTNGNLQIVNWGIASDKIVPADYDGDGKADLAIYRNGIWWIRQSTTGTVVQQFGLANDYPVPTAYLP